jgi:hypothetical protein
MTEKQIVELAWKHTIGGLEFDREGLVAFFKEAQAAEREACAKVCEEYNKRQSYNDEDMVVANECAATIRTRGERA